MRADAGAVVQGLPDVAESDDEALSPVGGVVALVGDLHWHTATPFLPQTDGPRRRDDRPPCPESDPRDQ